MSNINIGPHYYLNKHLEKSVSVSSFTRPIKVAYIVPYMESEENHWILDAVFYSSYTWWAGTNTLIIPSNKDKFLNVKYEDWLQFYDADFIYSYIDIDSKLVEKIDRLSCPISFIRHKNFSNDSWRNYIPNWQRNGIKHISSISTICSPYNTQDHYSLRDETTIPIIITQDKKPEEERFIADNFGTSWGELHIDFNKKGLFETLCLVSESVFDSQKGKTFPVRYGTNHISSKLEIFSKISQQKVITVSKLATIHDNNILRIRSHQFSNSFNIIVGETCIDRINFWNLRNLTRKTNGGTEHSVLIVNSNMFDNHEFVKILGEYLNNNNRIGQRGYEVALRSLSISKEQLKQINTLLQKNTYNHLYVPDSYKLPAIPTKQDIKCNNEYSTKNINNFRLDEKINHLEVKEPEHFIYTPSRFHYLNEGQWAIDLRIERHNNLSPAINITDTWMLPRRRDITQCFTRSLSKISKDNLLTVVPSNSNEGFLSDTQKKLKHELILPEDEEIFHCLVQKELRGLLEENDMRLIGNKPYEIRELNLSDKGQNLRGVISMFNDLDEAYECLTNKFWREVLAKYKKEDILTHTELFDVLPYKDKEYQERVKREQMIDKNILHNYLKANFSDALEYLVEKNIFFQVHQWRCIYCGHKNTRNIDEIKKQNSCEICRTIYYTPIDLEWKYKINRFVFDSLYTRSGLTVLWAIGYLLTKNHNNTGTSFYFLPEVDLFYDEERKEELDILCVLNGKFILGEAKKSSMQFTESKKEIQKFINKINSLMPDKVLLAFEQYSQNNEESNVAQEKLASTLKKIETHIPKHISIKVIVAEKDPAFCEYPSQIPFYGIRTERILDIREKNFKKQEHPIQPSPGYGVRVTPIQDF